MPAIDWTRFRAVLFDMDGVLTRTATLHAAAWKRLFDEFLLARSGPGPAPRLFDEQEDYRRYVDGRIREDGVAAFLGSRNISLPPGSPSDGPDAPTVAGLAQKKDRYFTALLEQRGVAVYEDGVAFLQAVRAAGLQTAVVSASRHCAAVLAATRLLDCFTVRIDGQESRRLRLAGKPAPDTFLEAAKRLGAAPSEAVVLEDALAGVQAARRGGFGLVIGVDRADHAAALQAHGADIAVPDLRQLVPDLTGRAAA